LMSSVEHLFLWFHHSPASLQLPQRERGYYCRKEGKPQQCLHLPHAIQVCISRVMAGLRESHLVVTCRRISWNSTSQNLQNSLGPILHPAQVTYGALFRCYFKGASIHAHAMHTDCLCTSRIHFASLIYLAAHSW
uniref:Uncharacterized protein n=1 Tax=Gadus morhua TaxID=8049 RepID=A0A8C5C8L0_GADMO